MQKPGGRDGVLSRFATNLVHAVFFGRYPHGDRYAKISSFVRGNVPVVPYIVRPFPPGMSTMRDTLGIPTNQSVLCRYGGLSTFDIKYVHAAMAAAVQEREDLTFLLANTALFGKHHPRIRFLPSIDSDEGKATFIRTCDAMLHARTGGETFGLAIAEFAGMQRRVITERVSPAAVHLQELKENAILYHDYNSTLKILLRFNRSEPFAKVHPPPYHQYHPEPVMRQFEHVFLS